jgi:peptidyl-prolyl cis-trans isomerase SurA
MTKRIAGLAALTLILISGAVDTILAQNKEGEVIEKIIGVVGTEIVLKSELEAQYIDFKAQGGGLSEKEGKCLLLEELLYQKLLINQAKIDSVVVEESQVEGEMQRRLDYFIAQIGSEKALEEYFKKPMAEIKSELRENLHSQLVAQRMQSNITQNTKVTPSEVQEYYKQLPEDSIPLINTEVEVAQIVFLAPASKDEVNKAKEKLRELRERIVQGEDFATMAILYSEDPGTAKQGGELGLVGRAEIDPAFAAAAFKLKGKEISRIVESQFGLHIIQLIERKGEKINVRHILIKPQLRGEDIARAKHLADSVSNLIRTQDTLTFEKAAYRFSEDPDSRNNGGLVPNPLTGSSTFELDELDPGLYYAIDKLKEGEISAPAAYKTRDGKQGYRIVYLKRRTEAHRANLKQDYQRIQYIALSQKRNERVRKWTAEKIATTHIHIDETFQSCNFINPWLMHHEAK